MPEPGDSLTGVQLAAALCAAAFFGFMGGSVCGLIAGQAQGRAEVQAKLLDHFMPGESRTTDVQHATPEK